MNRRDILRQSSALALGMAYGALSWAAPGKRGSGIGSIALRDENILRLGGIGDGFAMTWADDDRQFVVVNEGSGWAAKPKMYYASRLWTMNGPIEHAAFAEVDGYPEFENFTRPKDAPEYYSHGVLAVQGRIYQFLSTLERESDTPRHWTGAKLIYSADQGRTWCNFDQTSPVTWENWDEQSHKKFPFFREPDGCFSLLSFLQMGRGYSANRDGFVYGYGLNGSVDGRMNELVLFRAPIAQLLNRGAYEFFAGRRADGGARWTPDIEQRAVVHTFARGWVNSVNRLDLSPGDLVLESWLPSVVYHETWKLYLMVSAGVGPAPDGTSPGKPSYLGFWTAPTPWGPWRQIHEDTAWTPGGEAAAFAYCPQIVPRSLSADGKSCWIVWGDLQGMREEQGHALMSAALEKAQGPEERSAIMINYARRYLPRFSCNAQRVELIPD